MTIQLNEQINTIIYLHKNLDATKQTYLSADTKCNQLIKNIQKNQKSFFDEDRFDHFLTLKNLSSVYVQNLENEVANSIKAYLQNNGTESDLAEARFPNNIRAQNEFICELFLPPNWKTTFTEVNDLIEYLNKQKLRE